MKFTKNTFLILGMASIFSIAWIGDGIARVDCTKKPDAGKYCQNAGKHISCPPGCYCPGGSKSATGTNTDINDFCSNKVTTSESWFASSAVFLCPDSHPESVGGAASQDNCYYVANNNGSDIKVYYNEKKTIAPGYYLPKGTWNPVKPCDGDNTICPGGYFTASRTADVGKEECALGLKPNTEKTKCITPSEETIHCIRGEYLPANSESCAECPDGYYCPNEKDYPINRAVSQGNERCTGNKVPNDRKDDCVPCSSGKEPDEDHATCVDAKIHVDPGQYLRANSTNPISCSGSVKKFCPGGSFYKKSVDQGKYDCPFNSNANSANTACELKLTKKQMVNGVSGNGECWLKTDPEDYKLCIYGARFENASNTPTSSSTNNAATELKGFAPTLKNNDTTELKGFAPTPKK